MTCAMYNTQGSGVQRMRSGKEDKMQDQSLYRYPWQWTLVTLVVLLLSAGCGNLPLPATAEATQPAVPSPVPTLEPLASPEPQSTASEAPQVPVSGKNALYQDDFTDPATGWAEDKFDNYFIGYHEPEYYYIEITSPHNKTTVLDRKSTRLNSSHQA